MADYQLKDMYNRDFYNRLSDVFIEHFPSFKKELFLQLIFDEKYESRELKDRMHHTAKVLNDVLLGDFTKKIAILKPAAPHCEDGFTGIFFPDFVEMFGMDEKDYDVSINALEYFTKYSSSEFAVRPFIIKHSEKMMSQMLEWARHENHHVRRLATEGCRPRLPWAMALPEFKKDPAPILPILELLKNDSSEYVRKSVANNLNDISKDHPKLVLKIAKNWLGDSKNTDWIVKHACRTLLKQGNTEVMSLFGFGNPDAVEVKNLAMKDAVIKIGNSSSFQFDLQHDMPRKVKLRLEYGVYYMKSNGKQNRKVFKISENTYEPNKVYTIEKKQHFKELTTRKHYVGAHRISIIVNGVEKIMADFELI